jgi:hypothetical protein
MGLIVAGFETGMTPVRLRFVAGSGGGNQSVQIWVHVGAPVEVSAYLVKKDMYR